jgi:hypothetical protein
MRGSFSRFVAIRRPEQVVGYGKSNLPAGLTLR